MVVFISRRHACDQAKLVHHFPGRNPGIVELDGACAER